MAKKQTRGIRNHNPGNIEYNARTKWQGLANPPVEPEGRFARFKDATYGIRAIARLLITYFDKYDCDTVLKVLSRWAPPGENDTRAYARAVAFDLGCGVDDPIDVHDHRVLRALVCGIIEHENGLNSYKTAYSDAQIDKALVLAGVEPTKKPLAKSRTVQGTAVATATGGAAIAVGVAGQVADVAPAVSVVQSVAETAQHNPTGLLIIFGALVVACALYVAWARYDDRRRGLR